MILTTKDTAEIGKPIRIFDADGCEIRPCTRCDTETEECELFVTDQGGEYVIDESGTEIKRKTIKAKPPLTIEWV